MNVHRSTRVFVAAAALAAVAVFALGVFVALGVRSVVAGPDSSPAASAPNPGHSWNEIGDLPGTMWHSDNDGDGSGLDADTVDGVHASGAEVAGVLLLESSGTSHVSLSFEPRLILLDAASDIYWDYQSVCDAHMLSYGVWTTSGGNSAVDQNDAAPTCGGSRYGTTSDYTLFLCGLNCSEPETWASTGYITNVTTVGFDIVYSQGLVNHPAVVRWAAFE